MCIIIRGVVTKCIEKWLRERRCPGNFYRVLEIEDLAISREQELDAVVVYNCCSDVWKYHQIAEHEASAK